MQLFHFARAAEAKTAILLHGSSPKDASSNPANATAQYLAGGTTLLDLMKLGVVQPEQVIDINDLEHTKAGAIEIGTDGLRLGAMSRMSVAADHPDIRRDFPVISQSLQLAASAQIRNMASLGGNVLQRTRCTYFRDVSYENCNKRRPGSGCAALDGFNRTHAVLGTSDQCIATYPGDFAQALIALDARVEVAGRKGVREFPFAQLHRLPGEAPHLETTLAPEEMIVSFYIPKSSYARRSLFLKVRDRESYEFALASAAVALDLDGDSVRQARIALGGVATVPWRAHKAEQILAGERLNDAILNTAAEVAFRNTASRTHNAFKVELGKRTLVRALRETAAMEI
jgi:xanthine dehydrogenase YagS FAD-binding subunit